MSTETQDRQQYDHELAAHEEAEDDRLYFLTMYGPYVKPKHYYSDRVENEFKTVAGIGSATKQTKEQRT